MKRLEILKYTKIILNNEFCTECLHLIISLILNAANLYKVRREKYNIYNQKKTREKLMVNNDDNIKDNNYGSNDKIETHYQSSNNYY